MNLNKFITYLLMFIYFISTRSLAIQPTAKLFRAIFENSFQEANNAIMKGADLSAIDPSNDKTVLYEALENYQKQSQKQLNLNILGGILSITSTLIGIISTTLSISGIHDEYQKETDSEIYVPITIFIASLIITLASLAGSIKFIKNSLSIKNKTLNAINILSLIYREMLERKIKTDKESINLIKKLASQFYSAISSKNTI